ncbi:hypothetical protein VHA01S_016_00330 [Vibrio halioticoli NBRC 102217]|uniref:Putative endonuclease Z1 domain-containing protein n=1 Tax=Vibrio halioticoli NBRC 102217 TaxID=1219072 RepID=V5FH28_9VIBR|nr:Z1 domain-containing protein [Vibrio halioticoli]GAD89176.1 hypothetical protein VHA01S_016_00330 [Vibrio halioticoli NBRC 102217]
MNSIQQNLLTVAQVFLNMATEQGIEITPDLIAQNVDIASANMPAINREDKETVINELIRRSSAWMEKDKVISDETNHVAWLNTERKNDWRYWPRYKQLISEKLPDAAVSGLDESTDNILGLLEDPKRTGNWDRRGMVVGHVQSGKTGHYTGLINKGADAGYKIIIVLAGLHNNLRAQTQMRLDEGFLGYETSPETIDKRRLIGVGRIDTDSSIRPNTATHRLENGDFNKRTSSNLNVAPEERPWLFVIKKNKSVLEGLLEWIQKNVAYNVNYNAKKPVLNSVHNLPLLLIDDEADNASIDTNDVDSEDLEHNPTAINSGIRKILNSFDKSAYVAYTATPFANVFINEKSKTKLEGEDLFPSAFIVNLSAPSNYMGPDKIFFDETKEENKNKRNIRRVVNDHYDFSLKDGWLPPSHKSHHQIDDYLPISLKEAIHSFILTTALRDIRGQGDKHASMLVHVTRFTNVQNQVKELIVKHIKHIRQNVERKLGSHRDIFNEFKNVYNTEFCESNDFGRIGWVELENAITKSVLDIQVKEINGTAKDALDYSDSNIPQKVIAIGGDKLARGLTLEGLTTSYFLRSSKMYDTLMQMGRWFGYRDGFDDICRIYTTEELIEWYEHIATAATELREEFDLMARQGSTPKDFGLKVCSHPTLLVTSRLKMRSSETLRLSFSGTTAETVTYFKHNISNIKSNFDAFNQLVGNLNLSRASNLLLPNNLSRSSGKFWSDVDYKYVTEFLSAYKTHPDAVKIDSRIMTKFIQDVVSTHDELNSWDVALIGGNGEKFKNINGMSYIVRTKNRAVQPDSDKIDIGSVTSGSFELYGLSDDDYKFAMEQTMLAFKDAQGTDPDFEKKMPKEPKGIHIRQAKGRRKDAKGLLLLYGFVHEDDVSNIDMPQIGFAISFPTSQSNIKGTEYRVNNIYQDNEF